MELHDAIRRRAMVRSFGTDPVERSVVERLVTAALRAPTAGNTGGTAWVVLCGDDETAIYWETTTDEEWRDAHPRWWSGLRRAPVVLLAYSSADLYLRRYSESDKAESGLGERVDRWPVPYWTSDAAFGVMTVLLGVVDAGLGACILGTFRGEEELASALGVPAAEGWRLFCGVAVGHPDGNDRRSPSLDRPPPPPPMRLHWGRW